MLTWAHDHLSSFMDAGCHLMGGCFCLWAVASWISVFICGCGRLSSFLGNCGGRAAVVAVSAVWWWAVGGWWWHLWLFVLSLCHVVMLLCCCHAHVVSFIWLPHLQQQHGPCIWCETAWGKKGCGWTYLNNLDSNDGGIGIPTSSAQSHAQYIHTSHVVDTDNNTTIYPDAGEAPHTFPMACIVIIWMMWHICCVVSPIHTAAHSFCDVTLPGYCWCHLCVLWGCGWLIISDEQR